MTCANEPTLACFAARSLLERLQELGTRIGQVQRERSVEAVHQARVSSRRVRAALRALQPALPQDEARSWGKQVRNITRGLGQARDLDVRMGFVASFLKETDEARWRPGLKRLLLRLRQERRSEDKRVDKTLARFEARGTAERMRAALIELAVRDEKAGDADDAAPRALARRTLLEHLEALLFLEPCVDKPEQAEEHHRMRIEAKRLRYTLEVFEPLYGEALKELIRAVKCLQTALGELHDCDLWLQWLPRFMEEEKQRTRRYYGHVRAFGRLAAGLEALRAERSSQREGLYERFRVTWAELVEADVGGRLRSLLEVTG